MKKKNEIPQDRNIIDLPIEAAMPDNYLPYAVDVAKDRALPDVRDGLKPVHRRILYGAYLLKAYPDRAYYKSARIVGDIMGKFHPHGDSSIYDAMSILAQDFSTRVPLIEGQGNWGSQDGDPAAAMRYTEARLSKAAMLILKDIEMDTVDFVPNYSDTETEPTVLPSKFPNLLVNGSFGIAVGLSTNIPPHNLGESLDAVCALLDDESLTTKGLMKYIKGPDLPTGGTIIGANSLVSAYETGEGKCTLRSKTEIETLDNGRLAVVITEFPYRKNKARILQTISEMTGDKRHQKQLEAIAEIRDESGRIGTRAVIEFKRNTSMEEADRIQKYLLKKTDLQCNLNFNMVAIENGKPITFSLKNMLMAYINHQREMFTRRTRKELDVAKKRFHIVEGFIRAIDVMDELIKTIRSSDNKAHASERIIEKYKFTKEQATAILELMLYRLTGLELNVFLKEHAELTTLINNLQEILDNKKSLDSLIKKELMEVKKELNTPRLTKIIKDENEATIDVKELVVIEDSMVTVSKEGFIKKVPLKSYTRSNNIESIELRDTDEINSIFKTNTEDQVLLFTSLGNMYQFSSSKIPEMKWKDKGTRIDEVIKSRLNNDEEIVAAFSLASIDPNFIFKFITDKGAIKRTLGENFDSKYTKIVALKLSKNEKLFSVIIEDNMNLMDNRVNQLVIKESIVDSQIDNLEVEDKESTIISSIEDSDNMGETEDVIKEVTLPMYLKITTQNGLSFTIAEGLCEVKDKMIMPEVLCKIPENDRIIEIKYLFDYESKEFSLLWEEDTLKQLDNGRKQKSGTIINLDSNTNIAFLLSDGTSFVYPSYIFENISHTIDLNDMLALDKTTKVVGVIALDDNFLHDKEMVLATSQGIVKKLNFKEFNNVKDRVVVIKFKKKDEKLVYAGAVNEDTKNLILVTKKAMGIRFNVDTVSTMGKNASGVQGISLRELDEVTFATLDKDIKELELTTTNQGKQNYPMDKFKIQNRAGKGIKLFSLVLDEEINKVITK